jgi:hypothetical protein
VRVMASHTAPAPCPASGGPFFTRAAWPWPVMRGRCSSRVKRVVRSTRVRSRNCQDQDEVPFPVARHGAIGCLRRTLADHDLGREEDLASPARARPWHPQRPFGAQAGRRLAAQRAAALNEQRLLDGFMADAHGLVVREVNQQVAGDLLRAPGVCPPSVLPWSMPTAPPGHDRAGNRSPAGSDDDASQSFLDIDLQCRIERKLRLLGTARSSLGVPLRCRRAIRQAAASGGSVAPIGRNASDPGRSSTPPARAGARAPAWWSPARAGARSPPAPQTREALVGIRGDAPRRWVAERKRFGDGGWGTR